MLLTFFSVVFDDGSGAGVEDEGGGKSGTFLTSIILRISNDLLEGVGATGEELLEDVVVVLVGSDVDEGDGEG